MKLVVLARGLGTRMRKASGEADLTSEQSQAAAQGLKAMMPIGRPFLDHCLSTYADAGVTDVCLVIGPEHRSVREYYESLAPDRIRVSFAIQAEPRGTADAVLAAEEFCDGARFIMVNGDNYYPERAIKALSDAAGHATIGFERAALLEQSNIPAERLQAFALLDLDEQGNLRGIVEKPSAEQVEQFGPEALISMNCFAFEASVFDACRAVQPSARGELEIVDAVRALIEAGEQFRVLPVGDRVLDLSNRSDVSAVAQALAEHSVNL